VGYTAKTKADEMAHTYNRYVARYDAHEDILDRRTIALAVKLMR